MAIVSQRSNRTERTTRFDDSSDDSSDNDEEEERRLSDFHGEADEASTKSASNKQKLKKEDIEAEYNKTKTKKPRIVLKESDLTGFKGLIRIPTEFSKLKYGNKPNMEAAARYSQQLVQKYQLFCYDLFPGMAMEDVLARVETFGSKKEVKSYLNSMREEVRNNHLEACFGKDTAERWIQELQDGLAQTEAQQENRDEDEVFTLIHCPTRSGLPPLGIAGNDRTVTPTKPVPTSKMSDGLVDTDDEDEGMFNDIHKSTPKTKRLCIEDSDDDQVLEGRHVGPPKHENYHEDNIDEEENDETTNFDDVPTSQNLLVDDKVKLILEQSLSTTIVKPVNASQTTELELEALDEIPTQLTFTANATDTKKDGLQDKT